MKIRVSIRQRQTLIQPGGHQAERRGFRFAANVVARKQESTARTNETLLAYAEFISEANRRKTRNNNRADRNVAVSRNDLEPATDVHRIAPRLVDANNDDLLALVIGRRAHRSDAGPVENTDAVE